MILCALLIMFHTSFKCFFKFKIVFDRNKFHKLDCYSFSGQYIILLLYPVILLILQLNFTA